MLAHYFKPGLLVQDFIASIRPPEPMMPRARPPEPVPSPKPTTPPPTTSSNRPSQKPTPRVSMPPRQHPHREAPFIPSTPLPVREPQSDTRKSPEFATLQRGIEWLRGQTEFQTLAQEACAMLDDRAIAAMLIKKSSLLLNVLLALKTKF